jgi:DNA invertase Pin-like site-specific DNA recombinase
MPAITSLPAAKQEAKPLRVAVYLRFASICAGQPFSIAMQTDYYTEHIGNDPGCTLVGIYSDVGMSGLRMDNRMEFQRMLTDCKQGKINRIIVKSTSRFARNTSDLLAAVRLLKSLGVSVFFERENLDSASLNNEMLLTLQEMAAQEESYRLSAKERLVV